MTTTRFLAFWALVVVGALAACSAPLGPDDGGIIPGSTGVDGAAPDLRTPPPVGAGDPVPLPTRYAFVHGAPQLGAVRVCFWEGDSPLHKLPWPSQRRVPSTSYLGLSPGASASWNDVAALQDPGGNSRNVTAFVYEAYTVGLIDSKNAMSPAECKELKGSTPLATLSGLDFGSRVAVHALLPCAVPSSTCFVTTKGVNVALVTATLSETLRAADSDAGTPQWQMESRLLTDAFEGESVDVFLANGATVESLGNPTTTATASRVFAQMDPSLTTIELRAGGRTFRWSLVEAQQLSDPSVVPREYFQRGLYFLGFLGAPPPAMDGGADADVPDGGADPGTLRPVLAVFPVTN